MRVVILCGGSGTRLWPESRKSLPKQFISLVDSKSLLDLTVERILEVLKDSNPIFICNKNHGFLVQKTIQKYKLNADIFLEPEPKNTCAAIYFSAKFSLESDNLLILPSDHLIPDKNKFVKEIQKIEKNLSPHQWVTLGIKPSKPSDAYGYIKVEKNDQRVLKKVSKFVEKPTKTNALKFLSEGGYYWNAGIFIGNATMIVNSIKKHAPEIALNCDINFEKIQQTGREISFNTDLFSNIPSNSIDYAIMENENNIYLYPFTGHWNDVGSWDSISELYYEEIKNDKIIQVDSTNNFIRTKNRTIATIGVKDLIIVDSNDAILISKKNYSEKVKFVVNELITRNIFEAREHSFEYRQWGKFEILSNDEYCKVKKITVNPKKRLSLQYHKYRSEHWLIVSGIADVHLDGKNLILKPGQSIDIPVKSKHYLQNKQSEDLIIIETQLGTYFGEDDIIRLD